MRVAIAGAGVAGAILAHGLSDIRGVEVVCLERTTSTAQVEAGTGLNVGPNAIKALRLAAPDLAARIEAASLAWRRWTIDLTDGTPLFDLDILTVADNPGIRIRWAEMYRLLRDRLPIRYGAVATGVSRQPDGRLRVAIAGEEDLADVDLLIAADGRYSAIRAQLVGPPDPRHLGVSMYRLLLPREAGCPIDDYGQWFNGANRLLAFAVPGDLVYCAGAFPLASPDAPIPEAMKRADALRALYTPVSGPPCPAAAFLIDGLTTRVDEIHWARVQEDAVAFSVPGWPVLFLGDAAHPMIPTLGQGATQAVEDACLAAGEIRDALRHGRPLAGVPTAVEQARDERVRFVMDFSREASDTMLAGADPVSGTLAKRQPEFQARLSRLYRDVAAPT